jgi:hypothetical protein
MVGIITSDAVAANVANAPKPGTVKGDKIKMLDGMELESLEFERPVVVRGTDLPAGMLIKLSSFVYSLY